MIYKVSDVVSDIRVALDENAKQAAFIRNEEEETLSLNTLVESKVIPALKLVLTEAPIEYLEGGNDFTDRVFWEENGHGFVVLPKDFLRFVCFKMSDWSYPVYEAISGDDKRYAAMFSRFPGVSGNPERPVCALVRRSEGMVLEFASSTDDTQICTAATYIPYPQVDEDGGVDIPEMCYHAVVLRAAGLVAASMGDSISQTLIEISKSMLQ